MRRILFWVHLCAGVLVSLLVIFFSVTGALLAYQRQILRASDRHFYRADVVERSATLIPLSRLLALVPGPVEMVTVRPEVSAPVEVQTANREVYLFDRYSSKVQGPASPRLRTFFVEVTALHRWFGLSNAHHATAIAVKGATTLVFMLVLLSGPVLWLPKRWSPSAVAGGVVPRFNIQGRARNYNWHKVTGFWIGLPLTIMVITGAIMACPWANALLFRLAGSVVPVRAGNGGNPGIRDGAAPIIPTQLDEAFAQATSGVDHWQSASLRLRPGQNSLTFTIDRSEGGHPERREQITLDATTLRMVRREPFNSMSRGQQWRSWVRFIHTGEAGGWWGQSLALASASGAIVLALTGLGLTYDRLRRRWRR